MSIPKNSEIGLVSLTVADLARSLDYYESNIGLSLLQQEANVATLGSGTTALLMLTERPSAKRVARATGLYHFALLVPTRLELAKTLQHLIDTQTIIDGASDHLVSEALYLTDPDGNGIEIYRDRPRTEWITHNGSLQMNTQRLDVQGVMAELENRHDTWQGIHADTVMGHIHLHVSRLDEAEKFYTDVLGFDLMTRYGPSASFVSAGGYHHHIGMNTWAGIGAPAPPEHAIGLNWYTILLPTQDDLQETAVRLETASIPYQKQETGLFLRDPANNGIVLRVKS